MNFDEWLDGQVWGNLLPWEQADALEKFRQLVRAQREALKLVSKYTSLSDFVALGYQMNALEAALMGKK